MRQHHDPLVPQRRNKKPGETPDEAEQRLNADLRALMSDDRYRANDPDFRHYVQRQFRRVYDDPSGARPKGLRVGRPRTYASALEPFDRDRERTLRREAEAGVSKPSVVESSLPNDGWAKQTQNAADGGVVPEEEHDVPHYLERALGRYDPGGRKRSTPFPGIRDVEDEGAQQRYQDYVTELQVHEDDVGDANRRSWIFRNTAGGVGYDEAERAYKHYVEGSGEPLVVDAAIVKGYEPVDKAQSVILQHLTHWLSGRLHDPRFGRPWLGLADGGQITIGKESFDADRVAGLVHWETTFDGPGELYEDADAWTEARAIFNAGTLQSFSQVDLERHGDRIEISGFVKLRVVDRYDFEEGHILKAKVLEDHADAKSFDISTTFWVRPISGWIDLSTSPPTASVSYDD